MISLFSEERFNQISNYFWIKKNIMKISFKNFGWLITFSPWIIAMSGLLISSITENNDWAAGGVLIFALLLIIFSSVTIIDNLKQDRSSILIILSIVISFYIWYHYVVPKSFIQKLFKPDKYWAEKLDKLEKETIDINLQLQYALKDVNSNAESKIRKMTLGYMRNGMSEDSAISVATENYKSEIEVKQYIIKSYIKCISENNEEIANCKKELEHIK